MRPVVLGVLGVATAAIGWQSISARDSEPARPTSNASSAQAEPADDTDARRRDREIEALKRRIARLEAEQGSKPAEAVEERADPDAVPPRDPAVVAREREIAAWMETNYTTEVQIRVFRSYFDEVDRVRLAERPDPEWAASTQRGLQTLLDARQETFGRVKVERIDCGSTLCRIRLDVEHERERSELVHWAQRDLHFDQASALMPAESGLLEMVLAREGATLPQFDQLRHVGAEMERSAKEAR